MDTLKIAFDCDESGRPLEKSVVRYLRTRGDEVTNFDSSSFLEYPEIGFNLATRVASGEFDRGILICGTGLGMAMIANKVRGIYAATCHDVISAHKLAESLNAQIITLGAEIIGPKLAVAVVEAWLTRGFATRPLAQRMRELEEKSWTEKK